jgi:hypothetical protein
MEGKSWASLLGTARRMTMVTMIEESVFEDD